MRGLYIHIPFCVKKCRYCDFVSYCNALTDADAYIEALINEMQEFCGSEVDTIFIGGGTPTVLNKCQLELLCNEIFKNFRVSTDYEFTIEANPGTIDFEKARMLHENGVNRISLGVQSFNDSELEFLGRIHDMKTAYETVWDVHRAGFSNISIDIMTALPYQTKETLKRTIETAMELPIKHISAYSLIIEDGTPLARDYDAGQFEIPSEDEDREMYAMTKQLLGERGFNQYEISNFAIEGYESRHNIKYWECSEYIGLGAAAHSYINGERYENTPDLAEYISGSYHLDERIKLSRKDMMFEFIMMGLRMNVGISEKEFERRFGIAIDDVYGKQLEKFTKAGLLIRNGNYVRFSDRGRDVSNSVLCEFIED